MYNTFAHKTIRKMVTLYVRLIIQQNNLIGRLYRYFYIYFKTFSAPTFETLFLLVLSILAMESEASIRSLYRHFLAGVTKLSAAKMTEFSDRVVSEGNDKILLMAAIYGANVSNDAESSFEVYFTIPGDKAEKTYNYGFCVDRHGVTEEWLNVKAKTARKYASVFYRSTEEDTLDLSGLPKSSRNNIQVALEKQVLIVSLGAKLKVNKCKDIRDWFMANEFADFGDPFTNFFLSRRLPKGFVNDNSVQKKVIEYFASFDEHIKDFEIEKLPNDADSKEETYKISSLHKKIDSDTFAAIPLSMESAGTLKMFALYPELQDVLEKGSVFFIDELNARLHPLLVRNFLLTFLNPEINTTHAQLIFTTHDTWQLSNQLLRRDEVWFTEKDEQGISKLYSLADFVDESGARIRKDESYEKKYLIGKYGAIPTLKSIDIFKGE